MDLDRHVPRESPVHRFDARLKLILALAAIVAITLVPTGSYPALAATWLSTVGVAMLAHLGPGRVVRESWIVLPFALVALPLVFTRPGQPLLTIDLGPFGLTATREGIEDFLAILARSWVSVQVALLLAFTTPFPDLIDALRSLRVPAIMTSIIGFMYRYLAVIGDEAGRMNRARASRSASAATPSASGPGRAQVLVWRARVTGGMVGSLFIRSYERSERVYAAMLARGFDGSLRAAALARPPGWQLATFGLGLVGIALLGVATHLPRS
jgi:cobalt/nickel transport system permease protein